MKISPLPVINCRMTSWFNWVSNWLKLETNWEKMLLTVWGVINVRRWIRFKAKDCLVRSTSNLSGIRSKRIMCWNKMKKYQQHFEIKATNDRSWHSRKSWILFTQCWWSTKCPKTSPKSFGFPWVMLTCWYSKQGGNQTLSRSCSIGKKPNKQSRTWSSRLSTKWMIIKNLSTAASKLSRKQSRCIRLIILIRLRNRTFGCLKVKHARSCAIWGWDTGKFTK